MKINNRNFQNLTSCLQNVIKSHPNSKKKLKVQLNELSF